MEVGGKSSEGKSTRTLESSLTCIGDYFVQMFRKDGTKKPVAKFWEGKSSFGRFIKGRPASLDVDDSCAPILDEIIMTFVYFQKQRQNNNRQEVGGASIEIGAAIVSAT